MHHLLRCASLAVAALGLSLVGPTVPAYAEPEDPSPPGLSAAEQRMLAEDPAIEVSPDGTLFAVDEWHPPSSSASAAGEEADPAPAEAVAATTTTDAFALHSRPGAARTIYLEFDGGSLQASNSWLSNGLDSPHYGGWSLDSTPSFSDAERAVVREVWARVAEDFSGWHVDVTTQEPPEGGLYRRSSSDPTYGARVSFTNDAAVQSDLCGGGCGGIAWIGTFNEIVAQEQHSPAWVFPASLGQKAKNMAEAAAHEAGHTLGLGHDGSGASSYYAGSSLWGPLMGSPYAAAVTQWSRGSYPGANNIEDDRAVIGAHGLPPRIDEAGAGPATAADLGALPDGTGVIAGPADADWYALTACSGILTASASPAAVGPNLDIVLELRDAAGAVMSSHAPATTRTAAGINGMGASLTIPLTGGPYYLSVSGGGSGDGGASGWGTGGYDSYGSAGSYQLLMSGCAGGAGVPVPPPNDVPLVEDDSTSGPPPATPETPTSRPGRPSAPGARSGARGGRVTVRIAWTPPAGGGASLNGYAVKVFRLDARGRVVARTRTSVLPGTTTSAELVLPRKGRWVVRVRARNVLGWGPLSPRSAVARAR